MNQSQGYTIQLFMADGRPDGLVIATQFGWTGQVTVARQTTFDRLLGREDLQRPGVYILYGPDPQAPARMRAYIGEADNIIERIPTSADKQGAWWETAAVITTSDNALNKGHIRYMEARLLELVNLAGRATLENTQQPPAERRHLPEAEQANIETFLTTLKAVLPLVGLDLLKPLPQLPSINPAPSTTNDSASNSEAGVLFTITHRSGVAATAFEAGEEFVVRAGSQAIRDSGSKGHNYIKLRDELISQGILTHQPGSAFLEFTQQYPFSSPSAAASVVLDRASNGRMEWHILNSNETFAQWQGRLSGQGDEKPK